MSRRRNRSLSSSSRLIKQPPVLIAYDKSTFMRTTAPSFYTPPSRLNEQVNYNLHQQGHIYNKHIAFFRGNFNQNDSSQLPFMSSLRQRHHSNSQRHNNNEEGQKAITQCQPFQAALKNTFNQATKKNISDFSSKQDRLSVSFYRWHNNSGKNNKWGVQFQCSLRDYGGQQISPEKKFYPYVKPIVYNDVETAIYDKSEMACPRHHRSFKSR